MVSSETAQHMPTVSSEGAQHMPTDHTITDRELGQAECGYALNSILSRMDMPHSMTDYSISALSAFNGTHGDDRIAAPSELQNVATQTHFPVRPPRPPQSKCPSSRVNLRSKRLAVKKFKEANMSTVKK